MIDLSYLDVAGVGGEVVEAEVSGEGGHACVVGWGRNDKVECTGGMILEQTCKQLCFKHQINLKILNLNSKTSEKK